MILGQVIVAPDPFQHIYYSHPPCLDELRQFHPLFDKEQRRSPGLYLVIEAQKKSKVFSLMSMKC